jgi:hypothetical protein
MNIKRIETISLDRYNIIDRALRCAWLVTTGQDFADVSDALAALIEIKPAPEPDYERENV